MSALSHRQGLGITALGVLVFTPDALAMRMVGIDPWALACFRGLIGGVILLTGCWWAYGSGLFQAIRGMGRWGVVLALLEGVSTVLFCLSIAWTSVANAMLAFAATPLLAGLMARAFLGERVAPATWAAIAAVGIGLGIVATGAWEEGGTSVRGVVAGLLSALTIGAFFVLLRRLKAGSAAPLIGVGWLMGAALALPFATFEPMDGTQTVWLFVTGGLILPAAITLVSWGSRFIPAAEASMLTLMEVVTGPLLVWAVLGENPGAATLTGGAVIFATLAAHAGWRLRAGPAEEGAAA
ncbi:MAG: DMT family transporter [Pseudomonadota bacterium]